MKFGYSMLLQDAVPAEELTYGDCADFLVVCPICKEGLFKGIRPNNTLSVDTHYLSHYRTTQFTDDCELRVKGLSREEVKHIGSHESHGQTLEKFFLSFQEVFYTCLAENGNVDSDFDLYLEIKKTMVNPNFNWYFNQLVAEIETPKLKEKVIPTWLGLTQRIPLYYIFHKVAVDKAWTVGGMKSFPAWNSRDKHVEITQQFTNDASKQMFGLQHTSLLRFLIAATFTMCLRPNVKSKKLSEAISNMSSMVSDKTNTQPLSNLEKFNFHESIDDEYYKNLEQYPDVFVKTNIGDVMLEMVDKMFSLSKMKFTLYVSKWWEKGDVLNYAEHPAYGNYKKQHGNVNLHVLARAQIHAMVVGFSLFLVSMIPLMPSGRKYFRPFNKSDAGGLFTPPDI